MIRVALMVTLLLGACSDKEKPKQIELGVPLEPFDAVANVRPGMTLDEVKKQAPALKFRESSSGTFGHYSPKGKGGVFDVMLENGKVTEIGIQLFKRKLDELVKQWGPGMPAGDDGDLRYFTTDRATRVDVHPSGDGFAIRWRAMRPLADMLGMDTDNDPTFANVKLLDRTPAQVLADLKQQGFECQSRTPKYVDCKLPAIEWSSGGSGRLSVSAKDDQSLTSLWNLDWTPDSAESSKQAILDVYKKKWGEPKNDGDALVFGERGYVRVNPKSTTVWGTHLKPPPPAP